MLVVYQFNLRIINSVYRERIMKVAILEIPQGEDDVRFNQFTVLTEHANGYSYELGNFSVPMERESVNKDMDHILRKFKASHGTMVKQHMGKDQKSFQRVIDIALQSSTSSQEKEFYERMFRNTHKAKSPIERVIVTYTELLIIKEGQLKS